jgi:ADP-ribose pyrophosphatase
MTDDNEAAPDTVAVVVLSNRDDGKVSVLLTRQARPAFGASLELISGTIEDDTDAYASARRELANQAGLAAAEWRLLLDGAPVSPGHTRERVRLVAAWGLHSVRHAEDTRLEWVPLKSALRMIGNEIFDLKTVAGLLVATKSAVGPLLDNPVHLPS